MNRFFSLVCLAASVAALASTAPGGGQEKAPPKEDVASAAKGNNQFAIELYRQLAEQAKPDANIFFSPYSIQAALAMTYAGARGQTAQEMAQVLHFDPAQDKFHPAFAELSRRIRHPGQRFKGDVNIANAIWTAPGLDIRPGFKQVMDLHYEAALRTLNFRDAPHARQTINDWVAEQTRQKIKELLPKGLISADTKMVLVNAVYFRADWLARFDVKDTKLERFHLTPTTHTTVPTMHAKANLKYRKYEDYELLELPYAGKAFSMVIVLPGSHEKRATVEKNLQAIARQMARLPLCEVDLAMPQLKVVHKLRLAATLEAMGMKRAFTPSADFSGMTSDSIWIDHVIQEATIEADEKGTTAAAATAVSQTSTIVRPVTVQLNRPFLVAIRDVNQNALVFLGRITSPFTE